MSQPEASSTNSTQGSTGRKKIATKQVLVIGQLHFCNLYIDTSHNMVQYDPWYNQTGPILLAGYLTEDVNCNCIRAHLGEPPPPSIL